MYSKLAVVAVVLVAVAGAFADDFTNNCNAEKRFCQNGGVCHEPILVNTVNAPDAGSRAAWADPFCICPAGFGGMDCSRTIRECKDNPCQNGGTCSPASCVNTNADGQSYDCFTCSCPYGWTGSPALSSSSNPGGVCDWKQIVQDCSVNSCANGGTCSTVALTTSGNSGFGYQCACSLDYFGGNSNQATNRAFNCTVPTCAISAGACQNGGTCQNPTSSPLCACANGYWGDHCEMPPPCNDPNACPAGNTCTNMYTSTNPPVAVAQCTPPSFCQTNTCLNGGTCHDSGAPFPFSGGYCACVTPHDGLLSCNSTQFCDSNPCQNGASCSNSNSLIGNQGTCSCLPGWAGAFCEKQLNGCGRDTVGCSGNANAACACTTQATCQASNWNMKCGCSTPTGGIQHFDCRCNSTTLSKCPGNSPSNAAGSGRWADMVCQNGGTCYESADTTQCACRTGFWGDQCQNYDNPCLNNPCENGGQCYVPSAETSNPTAPDDRYWPWRCKCKWPYYGKNCEKVAPTPTADGLLPVVCGANDSPCQHGGTCSARNYNPTSGGYFYTDFYTGMSVEAEPWQCLCTAGWAGAMCEIAVEQCTATTCSNGGVCIQSGYSSKLSCSCPCGYAGERCEIMATNVNADSIAQYSNNGAGGVGYRLEFCSQEPCQNGGTCVHTLNGQGFNCQCKSGWYGTYCQYTVRSAAAGVVPSLVAVVAALAVAFALKH